MKEINVSESEYEDIIYMVHPEPKDHVRMERKKRAAQFAPFAALRGHEEALNEEKRITVEKRILDETERDNLDIQLRDLRNSGMEKDVRITYFVKDQKKEGGKYVTYEGKVKRVDDNRHSIFTEDNMEIFVEDIVELDSLSPMSSSKLYNF